MLATGLETSSLAGNSFLVSYGKLVVSHELVECCLTTTGLDNSGLSITGYLILFKLELAFPCTFWDIATVDYK